jgi:histone H3/H4
MFAINTMKRIFRSIGARRVTVDACEILSEYLRKECEEILSRALDLSKHAGRTTVLKEDIKLAMKR